MKKKKIFIICPVRKKSKFILTRLLVWFVKKIYPSFRTKDEIIQKEIEDYVKQREQEGCDVHWPPRDTPQDDDPVGNKICHINMTAILEANEIPIWYNKNSIGSHFDLGGTFVLIEVLMDILIAKGVLEHKKKVVLINQDAKDNPGKSFLKVIRYLEKLTAHL